MSSPLALMVAGLIAVGAAVGSGSVAATSPESKDAADGEAVRAPHEVIGQAEVWTPEEVGAVADLLEAESYWLLREPVIFITEGLTRLDSGDYGATRIGEIEEGVWANRTDEIQLALITPAGDPVEIMPGDVIAVGSSIKWSWEAASQPPLSLCKVTCGEGYFACCSESDGCRCRRLGSDDSDCFAGGEGAVSCEI